MKQRLFVFLVFFTFTHAALSLDLDTAKSQGLVGERADGYVGVITSSPETDSLVRQINQQRSKAYSRIAKKNGISVDKVGLLAGRKLFEKAAGNEYFMTPEGSWVQKSGIGP